jgi:hypothetical protein
MRSLNFRGNQLIFKRCQFDTFCYVVKEFMNEL